jgi:hypothetical protein
VTRTQSPRRLVDGPRVNQGEVAVEAQRVPAYVVRIATSRSSRPSHSSRDLAQLLGRDTHAAVSHSYYRDHQHDEPGDAPDSAGPVARSVPEAKPFGSA